MLPQILIKAVRTLSNFMKKILAEVVKVLWKCGFVNQLFCIARGLRFVVFHLVPDNTAFYHVNHILSDVRSVVRYTFQVA